MSKIITADFSERPYFCGYDIITSIRLYLMTIYVFNFAINKDQKVCQQF